MNEEKTLNERKEEILENLQKEWSIEEFVQFNEFNIGEKLQQHPYILASHMQKLENERFQLQKLETLLEQVEGEAFETIIKESDIVLKSSDIQKFYLPRNEKVKKVKRAVMLQQYVVAYFEMTTKVLTSMHWSMKQFGDQQKI